MQEITERLDTRNGMEDGGKVIGMEEANLLSHHRLDKRKQADGQRDKPN